MPNTEFSNQYALNNYCLKRLHTIDKTPATLRCWICLLWALNW